MRDMQSIPVLISISVLLATLHALTPAYAATQGQVEYSAVTPGQYVGPVLLLSVGSLTYSGSHLSNIAIASAAACSSACASVSNCTAWSYCTRENGCGAGCRAYAAANPKVQPVPPGSPAVANLDLPLRVFGPWTFPLTSNGCSWDPGTHSNTDAWPFGMCTLLTKATAVRKGPAGSTPWWCMDCSLSNQPDLLSRCMVVSLLKLIGTAISAACQVQPVCNAGEGWVSGTVVVPQQCKGLSAAACSRCMNSRDPKRCINCSGDPRAQYAKPINYILENGNLQQAGCAACANISSSTGQQDRCFTCILNQEACKTCVYAQAVWGTGPPDPVSCLRCAAKKGSPYAAACNACAQSSQPGRCFNCLDTFPLCFCKGSSSTTGNCLLQSDRTPCDLCANAALSAESYQQCLACHKMPGVANDCNSCSSTPATPKDQVRCYQCVQRSGPSSAGCGLCFSKWMKPGSSQDCLDCVQDPATGPGAKGYCASCWDQQHRTGPSSSTCQACLRTKQGSQSLTSCFPPGFGHRLV